MSVFMAVFLIIGILPIVLDCLVFKCTNCLKEGKTNTISWVYEIFVSIVYGKSNYKLPWFYIHKIHLCNKCYDKVIDFKISLFMGGI